MWREVGGGEKGAFKSVNLGTSVTPWIIAGARAPL